MPQFPFDWWAVLLVTVAITIAWAIAMIYSSIRGTKAGEQKK